MDALAISVIAVGVFIIFTAFILFAMWDGEKEDDAAYWSSVFGLDLIIFITAVKGVIKSLKGSRPHLGITLFLFSGVSLVVYSLTSLWGR